MVDDAPDKVGKRIQGTPVLGPLNVLPELLQDTREDTGNVVEKLAPYVDEIIED